MHVAHVPANVLRCLFVGAVDENERVVAWDITPCEGGMKMDSNGPQARVEEHKQDQELERDVSKCCQVN